MKHGKYTVSLGVVLVLLFLYWFFTTKEHFRDLPDSAPSYLEHAHSVRSGGECVPGCWDDENERCLAFSQGYRPRCHTKNKDACTQCPYCEWDEIGEECQSRQLGVIADEYDIEPHKAAFEINRPWNLEFCS